MELNHHQQQPVVAEEIIFRSKLPDIDIPNHLPLHSYIFQNIVNHADRPCLIDFLSGQILTYAELHLTARRVAAGLDNLAVKGNVIMLLLPNCPQFVLAFLGAIATTFNPFFTPAKVSKQAKASGAKLVITGSRWWLSAIWSRFYIFSLSPPQPCLPSPVPPFCPLAKETQRSQYRSGPRRRRIRRRRQTWPCQLRTAACRRASSFYNCLSAIRISSISFL
ncbi:unnamed protein product [Linum trigynum]|uniref:4-coumarate--CoA ligase n=1 Tax=Linum trigynum TaxID=586398 RepID=A0AAV2E412_9ROSI